MKKVDHQEFEVDEILSQIKEEALYHGGKRRKNKKGRRPIFNEENEFMGTKEEEDESSETLSNDDNDRSPPLVLLQSSGPRRIVYSLSKSTHCRPANSSSGLVAIVSMLVLPITGAYINPMVQWLYQTTS